jgi:hypothetical protein
VTQHGTYAAEYTCATKQGREKSAQMELPPRVLCSVFHHPPQLHTHCLQVAAAFPLPCSSLTSTLLLHQKLLENARAKQAEYIAGLSIHQSPHAKGKGGLGSTRELLVSFRPLLCQRSPPVSRVTHGRRRCNLRAFFLVFLVV